MWPLIAGVAVAFGVNRLLGPGRGPAELFFKDHVRPVEGSVLSCRLAGMLDHTGIYVGNGEIVHRDGEGYICKCSPKEFLGRLGGYNPAISIFVSSLEDMPVGGKTIARRALRAVGKERFNGYDIFYRNCHAFTQYCITGRLNNGPLDCTITGVERIAAEYIDMDNWRTWEWSDMDRFG